MFWIILKNKRQMAQKEKKNLKWSFAEVKIQVVIFSPDLVNLSSPVAYLPLDGDTSLGPIGISSFWWYIP